MTHRAPGERFARRTPATAPARAQRRRRACGEGDAGIRGDADAFAALALLTSIHVYIAVYLYESRREVGSAQSEVHVRAAQTTRQTGHTEASS
jgi:hypothetical protein